MNYVTLTYNSVEKCLADWNIATWRREVFNQASDSWGCNLLAAVDAAEIFPFGAMVTIRLNRVPASAPGPNLNPTLPVSGVTSWSGGTTWFVGYRVQNIRTGSADMEAMALKFAGPWDFFFERLVFQKLWLTWSEALQKQIIDYRSQVTLGLSVNYVAGGAGNNVTSGAQINFLSIAQQLCEISDYCATQSSYEQTVNGLGWPSGPQFQSDSLGHDGSGNYLLAPTPGGNISIPNYVPGFAGGSGDTSTSTSGKMLRAPLDTVNDMTCAECARKMLRWIGAVGSPVVWFDYTTTPPTMHIATRDTLPAVSLPLVGKTAAIKIQRRDDLIPPCVAYKYRIAGNYFGQKYNVVQSDIACTVDGSPAEGVGYIDALTTVSGGSLTSDQLTQIPLNSRRVNTQMATLDLEGMSVNASTGAIISTALNLNDPSSSGPALAFWTYLFPDLAGVTNLTFYNAGNPALTVLDNSGAAVSTGTYGYRLDDGNICPWMYVNNTPTSNTPGASIEATITALFSYTESTVPPSGGAAVSVSNVPYHIKTVRVKLTNLQSGTYNSSPIITNPGEPPPYGLAGYVYAIESIPQYQGSFTVQEQDITNICPIGNVLNLTGGLTEWETMNACLQSVAYDSNGKTTLTFGPAQHLGAADLVERLRINRGPRSFYFVGNDIMNANTSTGPTQLGSNTPKQSPSAANKIANYQHFPNDITDFQANKSAYTDLPPGISLWGKGGQPSGFSLLDDGPGIVLTASAGGTPATQWIKLSIADLTAILTAASAAGGYTAPVTAGIKLREMPDCSAPNAYRMGFFSDVYTHN